MALKEVVIIASWIFKLIALFLGALLQLDSRDFKILNVAGDDKKILKKNIKELKRLNEKERRQTEKDRKEREKMIKKAEKKAEKEKKKK